MRRDVFQAVADPTRRAIIALIALPAMTPNAIAGNFNTTRQAVAKHLRILSECEIVQQEQKGREVYYSLEIEKMKEIDKWLEQFREIWEIRIISGDNDGLDKVELMKTYQLLGGGVSADLQPLPKSQLAIIPSQGHVSLMMQTTAILNYINNFLNKY